MKKHRFPVVLTCLTLVLAILVTGLSAPGWLLPLFGERKPLQEETPVETVAVEGSSQAFTVTPVDGVTVSAPENALDKDRTVQMAPAGEEEIRSLRQTVNDGVCDPVIILDAWEFDLGLEDDELLPGEVELAVDLEALGVEEAWYDAVCLYRVDDSGRWYEYASEREGSTLRIHTRQNSLIVGALVWGLIVGGIAEGIDLYTKLSNGGYLSLFRDGYAVYVDGVKRFRLILDAAAVMKVMETSELGFTGHQKKLLEQAEEKAILQALRESNLDREQKDELKAIDGVYTINHTVAQINKYDRIEAKFIRKRAVELCEKYASQALADDPAYRKMKEQYANFHSRTDTKDLETLTEAIEQVKKVEEFLKLAYAYLRDEAKVSVHTYVMEVHLSAKEHTDNYGAVVPPLLGNPYMLLPMERVGAGTKRDYDHLLLTIVHELFHASQRLYVAKARANYGFDEMSAQCVEWEACEHFSGDGGTITTDSTTLLDNLVPCEYFAVPLDSYSTSYPEGKLSGDRANASYARAPFFKYLREQYPSDYDTVLKRYKSLAGHRYMTTILKQCFQLSEQGLTEEFLAYARSDQLRFYRRAVQEGVNGIFAPKADTAAGKAEVKLLNKSYTIRVRRVMVSGSGGEEEGKFALVLKYNEDFRDVMSDFEITPLNMERYDHYKDWEDGIFIEARSLPKAGTPAVYLLEADGGTASSTEGYIYNTYSGYTLYPLFALPEPELEVKNSVLSVKPPEPLQGAEAEIVDSVVITILLDKTQLAFEQVKYEGWDRPWTFDLGKLSLNGKALTPEQLQKLTFTWQQCVTGTFEYGPCLGPGEPVPIAPGVDITGTWDMHSVTNDLDMQWLYQYVEMMPEDLKAAYGPYLEQLRTSAGDFVMEVSEAGADAGYGYEVRFVYPEAAQQPPASFKGYFEESTLRLRLEPKTESVLTTGVDLQITLDGASMTCTGAAAYDGELASYNADITGAKRAK